MIDVLQADITVFLTLMDVHFCSFTVSLHFHHTFMVAFTALHVRTYVLGILGMGSIVHQVIVCYSWITIGAVLKFITLQKHSIRTYIHMYSNLLHTYVSFLRFLARIQVENDTMYYVYCIRTCTLRYAWCVIHLYTLFLSTCRSFLATDQQQSSF